ncbi:maleate cis-trans isomerase family protein [Pseudonocardia parietis]|uniref:Maleate isomerase n=1 Tax=Pseudonocardia parietis TaxID=570936 RepID=A0ABS4VNP5_9PSEU|nr:aspartate/glutamate racemase family protein [Pseudonocardia parietis]MBP2365378.1 maleate isomerase [Pseudonocardia parietis]
MSLGFGHLARVGHLYPSGGLCDYELQQMAPDGLQFITTRLPFRRTGIADDLRLVEDLEGHAELLADAGVGLVAVNCTAATMLAGPARVRERVEQATGIAAVTTIEAVLAALVAAGITRPALLTPYPAEVVAAEVTYLRDHGVEVATHRGPPCATPVEQALVEPAHWRDLAAGLDPATIDGVLLSCAGIRIAPELDRIEQSLGVPVVASNQALLWHVLRALELPDRPVGYGELLAGRFDAAAPTG